MSHAREVLSELLTLFRGELGAKKVVVADGGLPSGEPPFLLITAPNVGITHEQAALTHYHVTGTLEWWAFAAAAGTAEDRANAGIDLASNLVELVQDAHNDTDWPTLQQLTILLPSWDDVIADGPGMAPGVCIVHGTIRYETDLRRGG